MENETKFSMNTWVHCVLSFPVTEHRRKAIVEFIHDLWGQRRAIKATRYGVVRIIAKIKYILARSGESVHDPAVRNGEESLGFLNEVPDSTDILANLAQTSLQLLCPPLAVIFQEIVILEEAF